MSTKTNCEKCIFADYADGASSCAMGIIDKISSSKTIIVSDKFNTINEYRCPFAFSLQVYKDNINDIGSIEDLKQKLIAKSIVSYYMVVFLDDNDIFDVCLSIKNMSIKPKFISFIVKESNDTQNIINLINNNISYDIKWKLHNFLENMTFQSSLDTIFETNTYKNDITYFWINSSDSHNKWNNDISKINEIIAIEQPFLHALFRKENDGMFLTFKNYQNLLTEYKTDIVSAIKKLQNPLIRYYG